MRKTWDKKLVPYILWLCGGLAAFLGFCASAKALDPNSKDAAKIFEASENRDMGDKQIGRITMTLIDSAGRTRERAMQAYMMKFKDGKKNLMLFESPPDLRNTGFLSIDYDDPNKDDDQWLYLPALHRTTRVASADKSGSFLGTDISYSDLTKKDVKAYDVKLVAFSEKVDGVDCWVIEATPKTAKEKKETGYTKYQVWINKSNMAPMQHKAWVQKGNRIKYIKWADYKMVDGIWVPMKTVVRTVKDNDKVESTTVMLFNSLKFNQSSVQDSEFSQSRLEKGL
jgi:hypothetical protein